MQIDLIHASLKSRHGLISKIKKSLYLVCMYAQHQFFFSNHWRLITIICDLYMQYLFVLKKCLIMNFYTILVFI